VLAVSALAGCTATATEANEHASASGGSHAAPAATHALAVSQQSRPPTPNTPKASPPATPAALPVAPPGAAELAQTHTLPSTDDTAFKNLVHDFWLAVTTGNAAYALPAFFPEKAYEQVKAISDPAYDWRTRLWGEFVLDVAAVHPLVGTDAKLLRVIAAAEYAIWIPPGACYNSIGYWHVPGVRVVYERDGVTRSFGITSLISWRGDWYVVHLGAYSRDAAVGIVDEAAEGPGVPGPPGGC